MISVIIPCFNMQEYLGEALDSVLAQTVQPDEIIVIDDGSTDDSLSLARKYPIKVISQVNKGLASARNTGIMNATSDYLIFLDADDILLPNYIERVREVISETNADIVAPSLKEFGLGNAQITLMEKPTILDFKEANRIGYCATINKEALLEVGGYNPKMIWGAEDYDLWFDLLKRGKKLVTIPDVLWLYRIKENSMWTETVKHKEDFMKQIKINHPEIYE